MAESANEIQLLCLADECTRAVNSSSLRRFFYKARCLDPRGRITTALNTFLVLCELKQVKNTQYVMANKMKSDIRTC